MRCVTCNKGTTKPAKLELRRDVAGHTFTAVVRGRQCGACEERVYEGADVERFEQEIAATLAWAGVDGGEAFKFMRKAVGIKAADLAKLLDVAPETISRWETERHAIDRGAFALLGLLVTDKANGTKTTLDALRARVNPRKLPKRVDLKLAS